MTERKVDLTEQVRKMQLDAAWLAGQSYEREAIVAWLNRLADPCGVIVIDIDDIELIERGEHLRGDDE